MQDLRSIKSIKYSGMIKPSDVEIRVCEEQEIPEVIALLKYSDLPYEDISLEKINFLLAVAGEQIIGCIGLEKYQDHGLLRSFAIAEKFRNLGIGSKLYQSFLSFCSQLGVSQLHLFTIDAEGFFQSRGFKITDRNNAPDPIKQTTEFTELCPSTCAYMVSKDL